ncbi:MAG: STAS domain-containing protein [Actinomycetota bacterium]|nr:STAS domain-containing protein [Actinomycetota bacterium]
MTGFSINGSESSETEWRIAITGELDIATADELRAAGETSLARPGLSALTIDLGGLGFIDSTGISALLVIRNSAEERGIEFSLVNVPDVAARVLAITGLSEVFGLQPPSDDSATA